MIEKMSLFSRQWIPNLRNRFSEKTVKLMSFKFRSFQKRSTMRSLFKLESILYTFDWVLRNELSKPQVPYIH